MARRRGGLVGRRAELTSVVEERCATGPVLVTGPPGSGKSALLQEAARAFREVGVPVLTVSYPADLPEWDIYGFGAVLTAIRGQYETFDSDQRLPESIEDASRLYTREAYADPWSRFCLSHAMCTIFTRLSPSAAIRVLLDDVDRLPDPVLASAPMYRAGHTVIASGRTAPNGQADPFRGVAAKRIELGPLSSEECRTLLRRTVNNPLTSGTEKAVRAALGSLWGNPGAMVGVLTELRARDGLEVVNGLACLSAPDEPIAVPTGSPGIMPDGVPGDLGAALIMLATSPTGLHLEDLPHLGGGAVAEAGYAVDGLVRAGVLECGPGGRLRCRIPGIATAVVRQQSVSARRRLHRDIAERVSEVGRQGRTPLGHVAAAGREMPRRPELAEPLRALAPMEPTERAAWLFAIWWHTDQDRAGAQAEFVRHLVRHADYAELAVFAGQAVADGPDDEELTGLALASALAALHLGRPVPDDIRAIFERDGVVPPPLKLVDRWFAGAGIGPDDVAEYLLPAWRRIGFSAPRQGRHGERAGDRVADASAVHDLVPVLRAVLGREYRVPEIGPVAAYHRVCTGYEEGRWEDAVDAAHEAALHGPRQGPMHDNIRLLGAEMYGWRGEERRAALWLAEVPEGGPLPLVRSWVEVGLRHHAGDASEAFDLGLRVLGIHLGENEEVGAPRLFLRLARLAHRVGGAAHCREIVEAADGWYRWTDAPLATEVPALVRSLVCGDETGVRLTERLLRRRGDREGLVLLSEAAAWTPECPRAWLCAVSGADEVSDNGTPRRPDRLSETEAAILALLRTGRTNRQIARTLRISEKTVEKYLTRMFVKAGCRTRYGLALSDLGRGASADGALSRNEVSA
ncbi:helix-turn-helix transcriptional regulator [Amycolatopsis thailandensis]|uniref:helix-turn-helix transcriptional regulator n=1 Tax=Amycolatopsis thailandensis TaxID=589330 RepID=UPI003643CB80